MESTRNQTGIFGLTLMIIFIALSFPGKINAAPTISPTAASQLNPRETEISHLHNNVLPGLSKGLDVLKFDSGLPLNFRKSLEPLRRMLQPLLAMFEYRDSQNRRNNNNSTNIQIINAIINDSCHWIGIPNCTKEVIETLKQTHDLYNTLFEAHKGIFHEYFKEVLCKKDTSLPTSFCEGTRSIELWEQENNIN